MKTWWWGCIAALVMNPVLAVPPDPVESEHLITRQAMFVATASTGVIYLFLAEFKQPLTKAVYATVEFENPSDPAAPFVAKPKILPGEKYVDIQSDAFRAIRNPGLYTIKVWLFEDAPREHLIGTHEQKVEFDVPKKLLKPYRLKIIK